MVALLSWLGNRRRQQNDVSAAFERLNVRLDGIERTLVRIRSDAEQSKLFASNILGPDRALALLASGERIFVDPRDRGCGLNLISGGRYEDDEVAAIRRFLRPGATFLDIGANYGYHTICAVPHLRPGGRAIAFEPNPHIYALLQESIYLNGFTDVAEARRLGAYDLNDTLRFQVNERGPGGARILSPDEDRDGESIVIEVPVVRLDDHLPMDMTVDVAKIDVEGREEHVLRGMEGVIRRSPDIAIVMEVFRGFYPDDESYDRFLRFVEDDLELKIYRIGQGGAASPVARQDLRHGMTNVLLTRRDVAAVPALTIEAASLAICAAAAREEGRIVFTHTEGAPLPDSAIAHGPYVFLPQGQYRLVISGAITGRFVCQLKANFAEILWQGVIEDQDRFEAPIFLPTDAPRLELAFWPTSKQASSFTLERVEIW